MAVNLEMTLIRATRTLSLSPLAAIPFSLPDFYTGETVFLKVFVCQPDPSNGTGALKILDPTGLALKVGIGDTSTVLTSADLTGQPDQSFTGQLSLTVPAVTGLTPLPSDQTFEFQLSDNGYLTKAQFPIKLRKNVLAITTTTPTPPDVALTTVDAAQNYVPKRASIAGAGFTLIDNAGVEYLVSMVNGELIAAKLS